MNTICIKLPNNSPCKFTQRNNIRCVFFLRYFQSKMHLVIKQGVIYIVMRSILEWSELRMQPRGALILAYMAENLVCPSVCVCVCVCVRTYLGLTQEPKVRFRSSLRHWVGFRYISRRFFDFSKICKLS